MGGCQDRQVFDWNEIGFRNRMAGCCGTAVAKLVWKQSNLAPKNCPKRPKINNLRNRAHFAKWHDHLAKWQGGPRPARGKNLPRFERLRPSTGTPPTGE